MNKNTTIFLISLIIGSVLAPLAAAAPQDDAIARVGDQVITLSEIDTMINSSNVVGMNVPPPGTPARNKARLMLLEKIISANLVYLDALKQNADDNAVYQHDVERFADAMLASLYRQRYLVGDIDVSDDEIMDFYHNNIAAGTPFSKDVGLSIEATLRKEKFKKKTATLRKRLREGVAVTLEEAQLDPAGDAARKSAAVVARIDAAPVTWGEVRSQITDPNTKDGAANRREVLEQIIDQRLMVRKAKAAGLEQDPAYLTRANEFKKVRLINIHRAELIEGMEPTDAEVKAYFEKNRDKISVRETRKIQMLVLETKAAAESLKAAIESGKMTIYEAAMEHSIAPNARQNLGDFGWVIKGTGFADLDKLTFSLEKDTIGGPVQSPAGWHLVKVLDIRDAMFDDFLDSETRRKTQRMLIHERQDEYVAGLRNKVYPVEVYEDVLTRLLKEENDRMNRQRAEIDRAVSTSQERLEKHNSD